MMDTAAYALRKMLVRHPPPCPQECPQCRGEISLVEASTRCGKCGANLHTPIVRGQSVEEQRDRRLDRLSWRLDEV